VSDSPKIPVQADPREFGRLIAGLRESKGLTQDDLASRVPAHYADGSTYRRVELGSRKPSRDAAIAILRHGLEINSAAEINRPLTLLAYAPLTAEEIIALKLTEMALDQGHAAVIPEPRPRLIRMDGSNVILMATGIAAISSVFAASLAWWASANAVVLLTSVLYAALYAVSVFLESQHQADRRTIPVAASLAFAVMVTASSAALSADMWLVRIGSGAGLLTAFAISWTAAAAQWLIVRPYLSDRAVVPLRYEPHTAQAAHLKNTLQFLLLASVFWIPPMHAVAVLRRELALGHTSFVQQVLSHQIMVGKSIVSLAPVALGVLLLALIPVALIMGSRLVDNLKSDRRQNSYSILLYTRATLYFGLCIFCLGWYADALAGLIA
jgi:transcriptional regulator with XRE-family HTH domain